ncbi:MAG: carboxymuconolactone decarboxylase family protein [Acidimicrobiales bacterium]|nr:carboxymuconolactone decarboxylase family protein [Acidimicrobiales bacterium]
MTTFPIEHWQERAVEVSQRYNPDTGRSRMANNAFADLAPEFAELVQVVARGRCYADDTLDARTRALLTVACLVGMGEPRYAQTWISNALNVGATRDEIVELILQLFTYVGTPNTVAAFEAAKVVFDEREALSTDQDGQP